MSLLTGFNISLDEVGLLGQASQAAFVGGNIPAGWTVVTPAQLGLGSQYSDGIYFTDPTSRASAIVLQQGSSYIVAFRGTDDPIDILYYPELLTGTYIHHYDPLLNGLIAIAPSGADFAFTGASLGGGATNLMADIAGSAFGGAICSGDVRRVCLAYYQHGCGNSKSRVRERSDLQGDQWLRRLPVELGQPCARDKPVHGGEL